MPRLTVEQRAQAFQKSLALRKARAVVKLELAHHPEPFVRFLAALEEDVCQGMRVKDLVRALPGVGDATTRRVLGDAGVPVKNTVRGCGPVQLARLVECVERVMGAHHTTI